MSEKKPSQINWAAPGMRRIKLLCWALFNKTPLDQPIDEPAERAAAKRVRMSWETFCRLKTEHPEVWRRYNARRKRAKMEGGFKPQPWQLRFQRHIKAPARAKIRKKRPRFNEWAARKLVRSREYKSQWRRKLVIDRLFNRLIGM